MTIDGFAGIGRKCVKFKRTRKGRRCAKYRSLSGLSGPDRTCQFYTYTNQKGKREPVLRCSEMIPVRGIPVDPIEKRRKVPYHYWDPTSGRYRKVSASVVRTKKRKA
jgi:hypothetical protein